jgi:hypothetical protein
LSKKEEMDLRSAAHQHWLKYQELERRANIVAMSDKLVQLGWKPGDDLQRMWKGKLQKVKLLDKYSSSVNFMASPYKLNGELSIVEHAIYENEGWEAVKK